MESVFLRRLKQIVPITDLIFRHYQHRHRHYPVKNILRLCFSTSITPDFHVEPFNVSKKSLTNPPTTVHQISEEADRISKLLLASSGSSSGSVDESLEKSNLKPSTDLVIQVLKKLGNAGVTSLAFFRWVEDRHRDFKPNADCYHHLIDALGKIKQFRAIWNLVDVMKSRRLLTKSTFGLISRRYARAKMIDESIETFHKMSGKYNLVPDLSDFNHLIDTLTKSNKVKIAQELVKKKKKEGKFSPDLKTYTILLDGWGSESNIPKLAEVYQEMNMAGFEPDKVTYGILINAFCKSRKLEKALEAFDDMESRGILPTPHIYCSLINGFGADKRLNDALRFYTKFNSAGFPPDIPILNAVVGAYCNSDQFDLAYKTVEEMIKHQEPIQPNPRTHNIILSRLAQLKKIDEAMRVFGTMTCKPDLNTYTIVVRMLCGESKVDEAIGVWREMVGRGIWPCLHMFMVLINRLVVECRLEEACVFFEDMIGRGIRPPGQLYGGLIDALRSSGRDDSAKKLAKKLDAFKNTTLTIH